MSDSKHTKKKKDVKQGRSQQSFFVYLIIGLIIVAFLMVGGVTDGVRQVIQNFGKEIVENEDGTISIESEAQVSQNRGKADTYVGKVFNEKIQLGRDDEFNYRITQILDYQNMNPYQKYQYARMIFDQSVNKIIGMFNARKMGIHISQEKLITEVGKARYNSDGDVNYAAMENNLTDVNKIAKDVIQNLLFENYVFDYFKGLPVSDNEIMYNYKLDNVKIGIKYIDINSGAIDDELVEVHYKNNKEKYKMFKLTSLVFKEEEIAKETLEKISKDPTKFIEIGTALKDEEKVINILYEPNYKFSDELENDEMRVLVDHTEAGKIGSEVIKTSLGYIILRVEDTNYGELTDIKVKEKVKSDYITENVEKIEKETKEKADKIFKMLKDNTSDGFELVNKEYNLEEISSESIAFMSKDFPNINPDTTDDLNFMISAFKAQKGDILKPHQYENGFMIVKLEDKAEIDRKKIEDSYEKLFTQYSKEKSTHLETDFYREEKIKNRVVDNFGYVFNEQLFSRTEEIEE